MKTNAANKVPRYDQLMNPAIKEATRDGAPPIDLVDGDLLADKLKELKLGVVTELIEKVTVDENWFTNI